MDHTLIDWFDAFYLIVSIKKFFSYIAEMWFNSDSQGRSSSFRRITQAYSVCAYINWTAHELNVYTYESYTNIAKAKSGSSRIH